MIESSSRRSIPSGNFHHFCCNAANRLPLSEDQPAMSSGRVSRRPAVLLLLLITFIKSVGMQLTRASDRNNRCHTNKSSGRTVGLGDDTFSCPVNLGIVYGSLSATINSMNLRSAAQHNHNLVVNLNA